MSKMSNVVKAVADRPVGRLFYRNKNGGFQSDCQFNVLHFQ